MRSRGMNKVAGPLRVLWGLLRRRGDEIVTQPVAEGADFGLRRFKEARSGEADKSRKTRKSRKSQSGNYVRMRLREV